MNIASLKASIVKANERREEAERNRDELNDALDTSVTSTVLGELTGYEDHNEGGARGLEKYIKKTTDVPWYDKSLGGDKSFGKSIFKDVGNLFTSGLYNSISSSLGGVEGMTTDALDQKREGFVNPTGLVETPYADPKLGREESFADYDIQLREIEGLEDQIKKYIADGEGSYENELDRLAKEKVRINKRKADVRIQLEVEASLPPNANPELVEAVATERRNTALSRRAINKLMAKDFNSEDPELKANARRAAGILQDLKGEELNKKLREMHYDDSIAKRVINTSLASIGKKAGVQADTYEYAAKQFGEAAPKATDNPDNDLGQGVRNTAILVTGGIGDLAGDAALATAVSLSTGNPFLAGSAVFTKNTGSFYNEISKEAESKGVELSIKDKWVGATGLSLASTGVLGRLVSNVKSVAKSNKIQRDMVSQLVDDIESIKGNTKLLTKVKKYNRAKKVAETAALTGGEEMLSGFITQALVEYRGSGQQYTAEEVIQRGIQNFIVGAGVGGTVTGAGAAVGGFRDRGLNDTTIESANELDQEAREEVDGEIENVVSDVESGAGTSLSSEPTGYNTEIMKAISENSLIPDTQKNLLNGIIKTLENENAIPEAKALAFAKFESDILSNEGVQTLVEGIDLKQSSPDVSVKEAEALIKDGKVKDSELVDKIKSSILRINNRAALVKDEGSGAQKTDLIVAQQELNNIVNSQEGLQRLTTDDVTTENITQLIDSGSLKDNSSNVIADNLNVISNPETNDLDMTAAKASILKEVNKQRIVVDDLTSSTVANDVSQDVTTSIDEDVDLVDEGETVKQELIRSQLLSPDSDLVVEVVDSVGGKDSNKAAYYDPSSNKITLNRKVFSDPKFYEGRMKLSSEQRAVKWLAAHEMFHANFLRGKNSKNDVRNSDQLSASYKNMIDYAFRNPTVKAITKRMPKGQNKAAKIEEALAEINAAIQTDQMDSLKKKYNLDGDTKTLASNLKAFLKTLAKKMRSIMSKFDPENFSESSSEVTLEEVNQMMNLITYRGREADRKSKASENKPVRKNKSKKIDDEGNTDTERKYSPDTLVDEVTDMLNSSVTEGRDLVGSNVSNPDNRITNTVRDVTENKEKLIAALKTRATDNLAHIARLAKTGTKEAVEMHKSIRRLQSSVARKLKVNVEPKVKDLSKVLGTSYKNLKASNPKRYAGKKGFARFKYDMNMVMKYVLHGEERNLAVILKTNGEVADGSSYSNAQIKAIGDYYSNEVSPDLISEAKKVYTEGVKPLLDYNQKTLKDANLLSDEQIAAGYDWKYYVPLYGHANAGDSMIQNFIDGTDSPSFTSQNDNVPDIKNALHAMKGRRSESLSVFESVIQQSEIVAQRSVSQDFKSKLLAYAQTEEGKSALNSEVTHKDFGQIDTSLTDDAGEVTWGYKHKHLEPNKPEGTGTVIYQNGQDVYYIPVNDPSVFNAITNISPPLSAVARAIGKPTNFVARMYTQYSVFDFPLKNKIRDYQAGVVYLLMDSPTGENSKITQPIKAALNLASRFGVAVNYSLYNLRFTALGGITPSDRVLYKAAKEEYFDLGGEGTLIDFLQSRNTKGERKQANYQFERDALGVLESGAVKATGRGINEAVKMINDHMEYSSRIAMFVALKRAGVEPQDAADWTKNLMNYETKGTTTKQLNNAYSFLSTATYDVGKMVNLVKTGKLEPLAVLPLLVAKWMIIESMLMSFFGYDEEDLDKINMTTSGENLMIPVAGSKEGTSMKVPVGFGFDRMAKSASDLIRRYNTGNINGEEFVGHVFKDVFLKNLSPLQIKMVRNDPYNSIAQTVAPTILQTPTQLLTNKSYNGNQVYVNPVFQKADEMNFESGFSWSGKTYKDLAAIIYDTSGIDAYPEVLAKVVSTTLGGSGTDLFNTLDLISASQSGTTRTSSPYRNSPLFKGFLHQRGQQDRIQYNSLRGKFTSKKKELTSGIRRGKGGESELRKISGAVEYFKNVDKDLKVLRKKQRQLESEIKDGMRKEEVMSRRDKLIDIEVKMFEIYDKAYKKINKEYKDLI